MSAADYQLSLVLLIILPSHPFHWLSLPSMPMGTTNVSASTDTEKEMKSRKPEKYLTVFY
jgi:hypothetical protein